MVLMDFNIHPKRFDDRVAGTSTSNGQEFTVVTDSLRIEDEGLFKDAIVTSLPYAVTKRDISTLQYCGFMIDGEWLLALNGSVSGLV